MKTLELIQDRRLQIPMSVTWYLSDIGRAQGLQNCSRGNLRRNSKCCGSMPSRRAPCPRTASRASKSSARHGSRTPRAGLSWPRRTIHEYLMVGLLPRHPHRGLQGVRGPCRHHHVCERAVERLPARFRFGELQRACPGISYPTLKRALLDLKRKKIVRCLGKGREAQWERTGSPTRQ